MRMNRRLCIWLILTLSLIIEVAPSTVRAFTIPTSIVGGHLILTSNPLGLVTSFDFRANNYGTEYFLGTSMGILYAYAPKVTTATIGIWDGPGYQSQRDIQLVFTSSDSGYYKIITKYTVTGSFKLQGLSTSSYNSNLIFYKPLGWSGPIVVTNKTGTNKDSSPLYSSDILYVNWAVLNEGPSDITKIFYTSIYIDGKIKYIWQTTGLKYEFYTSIQDFNIGKLSTGTHKIKIRTDTTGIIKETNEISDNIYTKSITIADKSSGVNLKHLQPIIQLLLL